MAGVGLLKMTIWRNSGYRSIIKRRLLHCIEPALAWGLSKARANANIMHAKMKFIEVSIFCYISGIIWLTIIIGLPYMVPICNILHATPMASHKGHNPINILWQHIVEKVTMCCWLFTTRCAILTNQKTGFLHWIAKKPSQRVNC